MRRVLLLTAAAVVLAANAWALIAAWRNRSDSRGGTVELTERELHLGEMPWESTATLLELNWDVLSDVPKEGGPPAWLDAAKLAELGFDCTVPVDGPNAKEHYASMPPAAVFVVLEYEGQAWRQARPDRPRKTRLFAVDAGRDAGVLRDRHPDAKRHVITRGVVRLSYQEQSIPDGTRLATPRLQGWIQTVLPNQIFVPQPYSRALEEFRHRGPPMPEPEEGEPRFAVTVSWGADYEPWVRGVRRLTPEGPQGHAKGGMQAPQAQ
jgi:hypothetical protein